MTQIGRYEWRHRRLRTGAALVALFSLAVACAAKAAEAPLQPTNAPEESEQAATALEQRASAQKKSVDPSIQRLETVLEKIIQDKRTPGIAVGIIKDGKLVFARGFGVMSVENPSRPVTAETLFHMASITKPFVATSVMQLMERGKVNLDEPVMKYLPYFKLKDPRYKAITVRQLLTHTSGMPDVTNYGWDKPEYDDGSLERYVRSLGEVSLRWEPGTNFAYSNMAYEVLGDLVAKVSGKTFEDYVAENILQPVGMKSSTLLLKRADPAKLATGHTQSKDKLVKPVAHYPYNRAHTPSSNLHSNVEDMARWVLVNLNYGELDGRRILQRSTYDIMWKPAVQTGRNKDNHVGISWFLGDLGGEPFISHSGGDDGFRALVAFSTKRNVGLVVMTNSDRAPTGEIGDATIAATLEKIQSQEPPQRKALEPVVEIQKEDYAEVRKRFRTKLLEHGPAPQEEPMHRPPAGVTEVEFSSGKLRLKAWVNPPPKDMARQPAVLFAHGGFAFGPPDWEMAKPYRDAGYVVLVPILRGENGQPGSFSLLYDEVDDILAAAEYLAEQPYVDPDRLYLAGHSSGGQVALLAAMASKRFRAMASFDGLPDLAAVFKPGKLVKEVRFDVNDPREFQVRSPLAYATSFKCPARLYYSHEAWPHMHHTSQRTAEVAKKRGLDVEAVLVEGNHFSMVRPAMKQSIDFFRTKTPSK